MKIYNEGGPAYTLDQTGSQAVAFQPKASITQSMNPSEICQTIGTTKEPAILNNSIVRRLTECERLQGFPDDYTLIPGNFRPRKKKDFEETVSYLRAAGYSLNEARRLAKTPDGPRYKALGNSMAVPVVRWIGQRIQMVEDIDNGKAT